MKKNKKGFTLIELMIVVAIIGILLSIAIPKVMMISKCGGHKRNSEACLQFKAQLAQRSQEQPAPPAFTATPQEVNDGTIIYKGHVFKRID